MFLVAAERESGFWLQASPAPKLGTLSDPETLRVAIILPVGSDEYEPQIFRCGRLIDAKKIMDFLTNTVLGATRGT